MVLSKVVSGQSEWADVGIVSVYSVSLSKAHRGTDWV